MSSTAHLPLMLSYQTANSPGRGSPEIGTPGGGHISLMSNFFLSRDFIGGVKPFIPEEGWRQMAGIMEKAQVSKKGDPGEGKRSVLYFITCGQPLFYKLH